MRDWLWLGITVLALAGGTLLVLRRPARRGHPEERDEGVLAEAEREVRELDPGTTPEAADEELDDWGPGAPR